MSEEVIATDSHDMKSSNVHKKRHQNEAKRKRKRQRSSANHGGDAKVNGTEILMNGVAADSNLLEEIPEQTNLDYEVAQNEVAVEGSPQSRKRKNPFSMASNGTFGGTVAPPIHVPKSSPSSHIETSVSLPSKKIVQFRDSDDSDDGEYTPKRKPKEFKLLSPRHAKLAKAGLSSPKKVENREKLLNKRRELQEEREKLPIWTGLSPSERELM